MIPTPGRIVAYTLTGYDAFNINKRRADATTSAVAGQNSGAVVHVGNGVSEGDIYPMVIVRVWDYGKPNADALVNGQVLLDGNDTYWATSRGQEFYEVPKAGSWHEFPRIVEG